MQNAWKPTLEAVSYLRSKDGRRKERNMREFLATLKRACFLCWCFGGSGVLIIAPLLAMFYCVWWGALEIITAPLGIALASFAINKMD